MADNGDGRGAHEPQLCPDRRNGRDHALQKRKPEKAEAGCKGTHE